ncbi:MAG: ABC transporter substrate-binding protein, partial [Planctomycetes bacterium]|nr:ABC transporter substrate-binding protein [Planctomycetota bacterium]
WRKNPNYREALFPIAPAGHTDKRRYEQLEGRRLPLLSKVTYRILAEEMTEWQDFLAGQIDVCSIPIDKYDEVFTKDGRLGPLLMGDGKFVNLHTPDRPVIEYISFNMTHKSIGTPAGEKGAALRKAIGLAFDRQKYIDEHLKGRGTVATGLIPKGIVGFDEKQPYPWSVYSEEKARAVLTKAGFKVEKTGSGWKTTDPDTGAQPEVTILTRGTTAASKNMAAFIDDIGPKIGVKVAGECMDFAKYLRMQEEGKGHAYDSGWILDYPDAENILQLLWGENAKEFGINSSRYTSKAYDELYIRMLPLDQTIKSQCAKKMEIIQSMMKVLADDCPIIPLYFDRSKSLSHEWVYPYESCDFSFATAKYRFVDEDIRLKKSILWK